ncbi:MAG: preprotein translocase subunit SecG [Gammaproteobacteria bacterium]|nr:preprotein translocase subunit SecG [Gammaproteobacteria bacterium]MCP4880485.1 preprotein translocase subunit SecG [Gammaproteobacteria bacterium]MDP6166277.1 preprotein translocase subunit SecG [Gammaproteobacteria bacterium]
MEVAILIIHVLLAIALVGLILLQQGKGADAGASFGGGASQTVFGSSGSGNFLSNATTWIAAGLFVTSFALAFYAKQKADAIATANMPIVEQVQEEQLPVLGDIVKPLDADIPTVD